MGSSSIMLIVESGLSDWCRSKKSVRSRISRTRQRDLAECGRQGGGWHRIEDIHFIGECFKNVEDAKAFCLGHTEKGEAVAVRVRVRGKKLRWVVAGWTPD